MLQNGRNWLLFNAGSAAYDALTAQEVWREQVADVLSHVEDRERIDEVLDLGCGPGISAFVLARALPYAQVHGVDLSSRMIARARAHHARSHARLQNVRFHEGDATRLEWPDQTFDLVVGHSFLYLVPDPDAVLKEVRRLLAPGGSLVLLEPNRRGSLRSAVLRGFDRNLARHRPADIARFGLSMVAWRFVSGNVGRLDPDDVVERMRRCGFDEAQTIPTLGGLGIHCIARVLHPPADLRVVE